MEKDTVLLARASACWEDWSAFRRERLRCKRFAYGDQWVDTVDDGGVRVSEETLIRRQGNLPLKNNLIRRLVRNVLGVFRNGYDLPAIVARGIEAAGEEPGCLAAVRADSAANRLDEVYARTMEDFLIGGLAVHKKWFGTRRGRTGCQTDIVAPDRFFADTSARDVRGWDIAMAGEIHDLSPDTLLAAFGPSDTLKALYGIGPDADMSARTCRVTEVWTLRHRRRWLLHDPWRGTLSSRNDDPSGEAEAENQRRLKAGMPPLECIPDPSEMWACAFLAPDGTILRAGDSPYPGGRHPYVWKAYPFVDGEIHSFVADIIDQQKLTNRLISMYDWILRASAKGVLLFPEEALPEGVDFNEIAEEWSRFNGVIVYRPRPGMPLPQQVSSNSTDIGIIQLLDIQMKLMEDISGVNGALQGKLESNSMSGTLYDQQTRNSMTALQDLLLSFDDFMVECAAADAANTARFAPKRTPGP